MKEGILTGLFQKQVFYRRGELLLQRIMFLLIAVQLSFFLYSLFLTEMSFEEAFKVGIFCRASILIVLTVSFVMVYLLMWKVQDWEYKSKKRSMFLLWFSLFAIQALSLVEHVI